MATTANAGGFLEQSLNKTGDGMQDSVSHSYGDGNSREDSDRIRSQLHSNIDTLHNDLETLRESVSEAERFPNRSNRFDEVQNWNRFSASLVRLKRATGVEAQRGANSPYYGEISRLRSIESKGNTLRDRIAAQLEGGEGLIDQVL